jgi:hypothetical protein
MILHRDWLLARLSARPRGSIGPVQNAVACVRLRSGLDVAAAGRCTVLGLNLSWTSKVPDTNIMSEVSLSDRFLPLRPGFVFSALS